MDPLLDSVRTGRGHRRRSARALPRHPRRYRADLARLLRDDPFALPAAQGGAYPRRTEGLAATSRLHPERRSGPAGNFGELCVRGTRYLNSAKRLRGNPVMIRRWFLIGACVLFIGTLISA